MSTQLPPTPRPCAGSTTQPTGRPVQVLLHAPRLLEGGLKTAQLDGELLTLYAALQAAGLRTTLVDSYYRHDTAPTLSEHLDQALTQPKAAAGHAADQPDSAALPRPDVRAAVRPDVVVVHLWTSDAYGPRLARIAADLAAVRDRWQVPIVVFGPLATSAAADLQTAGAVDHIVSRGRLATPWPSLDQAFQLFFSHGARLTQLSAAELPYGPDAVVSVAASHGCRSRCTFCAYNADALGGWHPRSVGDAVADIAHVHRLTGAVRFALSDSDFGGSRSDCRQRAADLLAAVRHHDLLGRVQLSVNIRSETLDADSVHDLAAAGVRVMLIGVESLNPDTLHRLYGKRQDLDHLQNVVQAAEAAGVMVVASYILWHPWQTIPRLRRELQQIAAFGRHRIPQFMARSRLVVIPGTALERRLSDEDLLVTGPFRRGFRYVDPDAAALDQELTTWFQQHAVPVLDGLSDQDPNAHTTLAQLKIQEWQYLLEAVARPDAADPPAALDPALTR